MDRYESQCFSFKSVWLCRISFVPYELRKKLDKKGHKCIFVGYSEDTKAYKLYDPIARKVIISHDIQFIKNESWHGTVERKFNIVSNAEHDDMA